MAFELQHFPQHHLILIPVSGSVSLDENLEIGRQLVERLETVATKTDVLFDLRALEQFPTSIRQLRASSVVIANPKLGWIILLTNDKPLLRFVATVLLQLQTHTGRFRSFNSISDVIHFLAEVDPTAPNRTGWLSELHKSLMQSEHNV